MEILHSLKSLTESHQTRMLGTKDWKVNKKSFITILWRQVYFKKIPFIRWNQEYILKFTKIRYFFLKKIPFIRWKWEYILHSRKYGILKKYLLFVEIKNKFLHSRIYGIFTKYLLFVKWNRFGYFEIEKNTFYARYE